MGFLSRIKNPISGTAQIVNCTSAPIENTQAPCTMALVVQAPGVAPFSSELTEDLWPGKWPTAGSTLAVTFDRDHTDRIRIEWDRPAADVTAAPAVSLPPGSHTETTVITMGTGQPMQILGNANSEAAKQAIARAEQLMHMDLDGDGTVAGAPAGPGQQLDVAALMAQAQAAMANLQQSGAIPVTFGTPPGAAPAAPAPQDTIAELERLGNLRDRGALTDAEFEAQKKRILGES
jgi:hypothetical protein